MNAMPEMPLLAGWRVAPLAEFVDILDSRRVPVNADERAKRPGAVPYFGATGQVGWIDDYLFDEELVLLGEDGAPFLDSAKPKAYLISGKTWVNNHAHVLRAKPGLLNSFLMHQLNQVKYEPYVSGTTRLKLPQGPMRTIPLLVPPLAVQEQIVNDLDSDLSKLEAGAAALKRVQANLKRYRAAVLKAACEGRLVPTEAALARQEGRPYEPASALLERVEAERSDRVAPPRRSKQRGNGRVPPSPDLPRLPEGWAWTALESVTSRTADLDHRMPKATAGGLPYVSSRDFSGHNEIDFDRAKQISREDFAALARKVQPEWGDLLLSRYGTVGLVRFVRTSRPFLASYSVAVIKTLPTPQLNAYLDVALRSEVVQSQMRDEIRASAQPDLGLASIRGILVPIPPDQEQARLVAEVDRRLSVADGLDLVLVASLRHASRLRQAVLAWFLSPKPDDSLPAGFPYER